MVITHCSRPLALCFVVAIQNPQATASLGFLRAPLRCGKLRFEALKALTQAQHLGTTRTTARWAFRLTDQLHQ